MKKVMLFIEVMIVFVWVALPIATLFHLIVGNIEQAQNGFNLIGEMLNFEFMVITCLVGIYSVLESKYR